MALDLSALRRIIADENRLLSGADIPAEYQSDVLGRVHGSAEALAFPLSTEEVSALLRYAHEHRVPVTPRGAGTNLVGSKLLRFVLESLTVEHAERYVFYCTDAAD